MESLFAGTKIGIKFAPNISLMFKEVTNLADRYSEAAKRGFTAVECQFPYSVNIEELVRRKVEAGVEHILINSFQGRGHGDIGFACQPTKHAEFKESLELSIRYAKALNCKKIHIMAGTPQLGVTLAESEATYIKNLCHAARELQKENLMGLIEPLCKGVCENYFLQSYEKAAEYIKRVNSSHIRILLDIYHLQMIHGNLTFNITALARYAGHVQISQAPKRTEPGATGEIDYQYILNLLDELGYTDYIGLEYSPSGRTEESLRFLRDWGYLPHVRID